MSLYFFCYMRQLILQLTLLFLLFHVIVSWDYLVF